MQGRPPSELYQRWVAFGLFSSHSRLHGSGSYRIPWEYGEDAAKSMGRFVEAKHRLMPYLYGLVSSNPESTAEAILFFTPRRSKPIRMAILS